MPRRKKLLLGLNKKQAELWSDKLVDLGNLLLTGVLLTQGFSKERDSGSIVIALIVYGLLSIVATYLRR